MPQIIGIDPGKYGAIALISSQPQGKYEIKFWLLSDIEGNRTTPLDQIIAAYGVEHVYIEQSHAMPGQGVVSMFNYGMGYGKIIGWCEMIGVPFTTVHPRTWTKDLHKGCKGKNAKEKSEMAVKRLFPKEELRATSRCIRLHPGLVDALLIAEYGRRVYR